MAYTINKTDGTALVTVADGAINTTYSITLIGKNYAGYGEVLNENQIKLSENFANTTANAPASPLTGQTFYDTTTNQLKVYDGAQFKTCLGASYRGSQLLVANNCDPRREQVGYTGIHVRVMVSITQRRE